MSSKEQVIEMLKSVMDPELQVDIWTMGLVYDINIIDKKAIELTMTFTTPFCPVGEQIKEEVEDALRLLKFKDIKIVITFDPPWKPSQELRAALGLVK